MWNFYCLLFVVNCFAILTSYGTAGYRLSSDAKPTHYSLKLQPDIDSRSFNGEVSIYIRIRNSLDRIIMHSCELDVTEVYINEIAANWTYEKHEKLAVFYENSTIQPGEHRVFLRFSGRINEDFGMVIAKYSKGKDFGYIVANEFEPTSARKTFPCFDEPSFKAKFNIRIVVPNDTYTAISNMPSIGSHEIAEGIVYDFATTVLMSTYLVSFAMVDFGYYEEKLVDSTRQIPIRIYAYNASRENNAFAISKAIYAIKYYEEYTGIQYPLPKLDMVQYAKNKSVATEIWGLIQFKEGLLSRYPVLFDEWQIELVMFHELAHFWFGNLVTNDWWNDLWLQEGFAVFMSYKLQAQNHNIDLSYELRRETVSFYDKDKLNSSMPVVYYMGSPDVERKFTGLLYEKGAAFINMVYKVLGEDTFQKVVKKYLQKFAYKSATTNDFISIIEEVYSNHNIRSMMESYVYQNKYPIVNVINQNGTYVLTQELCTAGKSENSFGQKWTIPISYTTDVDKTAQLVWFDKDADTVTVNLTNAKWVLFNSLNFSGLYVTNYPPDMVESLIEHNSELGNHNFHVLLDDWRLLYLTGKCNCDVFFKAVEKINRHHLYTLFNFYGDIMTQLICHKEDFKLFKQYMGNKFSAFNLSPVELGIECNEVNKTADEHTSKCIQWMRNNLNTT